MAFLIEPETRDEAIALAKQCVEFSVEKGLPCAFCVFQKKSGKFDIVPFGLKYAKTDKLLHVEPIPVESRGI